MRAYAGYSINFNAFWQYYKGAAKQIIPNIGLFLCNAFVQAKRNMDYLKDMGVTM